MEADYEGSIPSSQQQFDYMLSGNEVPSPEKPSMVQLIEVCLLLCQ